MALDFDQQARPRGSPGPRVMSRAHLQCGVTRCVRCDVLVLVVCVYLCCAGARRGAMMSLLSCEALKIQCGVFRSAVRVTADIQDNACVECRLVPDTTLFMVTTPKCDIRDAMFYVFSNQLLVFLEFFGHGAQLFLAPSLPCDISQPRPPTHPPTHLPSSVRPHNMRLLRLKE